MRPQASKCQFHQHVYGSFCAIEFSVIQLLYTLRSAVCHVPKNLAQICWRKCCLWKLQMLVKLTTGLQMPPDIFKSASSTDLIHFQQSSRHSNPDLDPSSNEFSILQFSDSLKIFQTSTSISSTKANCFHSGTAIKFLLPGSLCFSVKFEVEESFWKFCVGWRSGSTNQLSCFLQIV